MEEEVKSSLDILAGKLEGWGTTFMENLPNIVLAVVVLFSAYFIARYTSKGVTKLVQKRVPQKSITNLISNITTVVVVLIGLFLALSILDLNDALMSLLTGAGVAGLVVGLALQGTLSNTISGVVLSFRKNIRIGDWIETNGFAGEVIKINLNNFIIKEADNNKVIIPNKTILENPLKNFTLTNKMRVVLECGVGYESDLDSVEELTKSTISKAIEQVSSEDEVDMYTDARIKIDEIAERILTLRYHPMSNLSAYLKTARIKESSGKLQDREMVEEILQAHNILLKQMSEIIAKAEAIKDEGTIDLMGAYIREMEKTSWMLHAWNKDKKGELNKTSMN